MSTSKRPAINLHAKYATAGETLPAEFMALIAVTEMFNERHGPKFTAEFLRSLIGVLSETIPINGGAQ